MAKEVKIIIKDGEIRFIHDDDLTNLMEQGIAHTKRASHVEPDDDNFWWADLSPVNGPKLGPFIHRKEALAAEVSWINNNQIPKPG